ncbi:MAG: YggS family pyridoxal phosphate-dependent enzyme [Candidatus Coatesbacteria bacterium]|nr:YggS family pyridoxal phosphate-dependent enzyme [Candidatus Coatesbacteria bacterium]
MESIKRNLEEVREKIEKAAARAGRSVNEITLVGVSKVQPIEKVQAAVDAGLKYLGENRVQEASDKIPVIRGDVHWRLIGHLQRNKAKRAVELFDMIESIDSDRLAEEVAKRCVEAGKTMDILLEVNVGDEDAKTGIESANLMDLARFSAQLEGISVKGIMVIPPFDPNPENSRPYFVRSRKLFEELRDAKIDGLDIHHLSMGMSADYEVAIEEGATIVRVGTAIFGQREYH